MWHLFAQAEPAAPLLLPDSVQKANFAKAVDKLANLDLQQLLQDLLSQSMWILVKLLVALFIYLVGRWVLRRLLRLLDAIFERRRVDTSLRTFARNTLGVVFSLILILIVVQTLGVNVTSLIAVFSAATLAIGMALSGTAQNFAGGVMILLIKPYRVGDFITAQGQSGTVSEIKLFSTVITTGDNRTIYIPNNSIATAIIDNASTASLRRVDWNVSIAYGDDVEAARRALLEVLAGDERVLREPTAVVRVQNLAESAVSLTVRAWTRTPDYWDVFFDNYERFYHELPGRGLHFPFPQVDVHMPQK